MPPSLNWVNLQENWGDAGFRCEEHWRFLWHILLRHAHRRLHKRRPLHLFLLLSSHEQCGHPRYSNDVLDLESSTLLSVMAAAESKGHGL